MRIADAAYAAEDVIESNIVDRILPPCPEIRRHKMWFFNCFRSQKKHNDVEKIDLVDLYEGLKKVIDDMDLIVAEKEVVQVSSAWENKLSSLINTMVGFDDVRLEIMDKLTDGRLNRHVIPIVGMGGIGFIKIQGCFMQFKEYEGVLCKFYKIQGCTIHFSRFLHNIECLHKLESLSCVCHRYGDYLKKLSFPHSLKKLTLCKGSNVEDMLVKIRSLPLLEKLSLYGMSSRTGTGEVVEGQFPSLKFLSLKWIHNLEIWTTESSPFPCLEHLHLKGLWLLKEIPIEIGEIPTLKSIVFEECTESAVKSMKKIVEEQQELQGDDLPFKVQVFLGNENQ